MKANRNRAAIIHRLRENRGHYLSGAAISAMLGISRAAVWKEITALRREGYRIAAKTRLGYRLDREPDRLDRELLALNGVVYYQAVDSTNAAARRIAEENPLAAGTVIAERQTAGRGRRGRSWESPPGTGLWFSLLLRPGGIAPGAAVPVTLVCAVSLAETLRSETGLPVCVKWPNDLLVKGRKVCGILTEFKGEPDRLEYLVIGVGININQAAGDFPDDLRSRATSIRLESGLSLDRTALFFRLKDDLEQSCREFFKNGFARFRQAWMELNCTLGLPVTVTWAGGTLRGAAVDLDHDGALLVRDNRDQRLHRVNYGEIAGESTGPVL